MQVQINTGHDIDGHEAFTAHIRGVVETALARFSDHITRVEVHLSDANGNKKGPSTMRCMLEARLEGRQPVAVTHQAETVEEAVQCAADKMTKLIESTTARLRDQRNRRTDPPPPGSGLTEQS
jgi:ribosome-associated translation inhibitor RaiA